MVVWVGIDVFLATLLVLRSLWAHFVLWFMRKKNCLDDFFVPSLSFEFWVQIWSVKLEHLEAITICYILKINDPIGLFIETFRLEGPADLDQHLHRPSNSILSTALIKSIPSTIDFPPVTHNDTWYSHLLNRTPTGRAFRAGNWVGKTHKSTTGTKSIPPMCVHVYLHLEPETDLITGRWKF